MHMLTLTALRITSSCTVKVYLGLICLYSGIFTFSVALPQKPTVAIDELSQDVTFIEDIRDKYHRPNNILHLLVPTVNASIYIERCHIFKKMLTTAFKRPKVICVGYLCSYIVVGKITSVEKR